MKIVKSEADAKNLSEDELYVAEKLSNLFVYSPFMVYKMEKSIHIFNKIYILKNNED